MPSFLVSLNDKAFPKLGLLLKERKSFSWRTDKWVVVVVVVGWGEGMKET